MCKFKSRLLIALLTFGISVLVIGIWKSIPASQNQNEAIYVETSSDKTAQKLVEEIPDQSGLEEGQISFLNCSDQKNQISFQGISFICNSQLGSKSKVTEFPKHPLDSEDDKPDYVHPSYLQFEFKNAERKTSYSSQISVYPIEEYSQMYSISKDARKYFDEDVLSLKKLLSKRSASLDKHNSFLGATDGSFDFKSHLKNISFKNGKGVGFVTQIQIEVTIINNEELVWIFEGITDDGKQYVRAIFPIQASILPESYDGEFEGYSVSDYSSLFKRNEQYLSLVKRRLNSLPSNQYQPKLENLIQFISSIEVK